jgi:hypothetical protein
MTRNDLNVALIALLDTLSDESPSIPEGYLVSGLESKGLPESREIVATLVSLDLLRRLPGFVIERGSRFAEAKAALATMRVGAGN